MSPKPQGWIGGLTIAVASLAAGGSPAAAQLPLGGPVLVNSATQAGDQQSPSVGMANDGRLRVFWNELTTQDVRQRSFAADGTAANASAPNQSDHAETDASGSVNGSGDWIVSWSTNLVQDGGLDAFARRSSTNGSVLAAEFQIHATAAVDIQRPLRLSRADDDSYVAVWIDELAADQLQFRKFAANGTPANGDSFVTTSSEPDLAAFDVAAAPDGSFLVAWQGGPALNEQVFARCFDPSGVPLGAPFTVPADQPTRNFRPRVGVDALGFYVVTWGEGGSTDIEWRRFAPDCTPRGSDRLAIAAGIADNFEQEFDVAPDGAMILVWRSTELDPSAGISVLELTKSGAAVGGEFLAHASAAGFQTGADVGIGDRLFAVVWQDPEGANPGDDDIRLQRFVRRVVFTEDFETATLDYWSAAVP